MVQIMAKALSLSPTRTPSQPARKRKGARPALTLSDDAYIEYRRQRVKENQRRYGTKKYSKIRFSKDLEVYTKTPRSSYPETPTKSILRNKTNERKTIPERGPCTQKQSIFDKFKSIYHQIPRTGKENESFDTSQGVSVQPSTAESGKTTQDWDVASLFQSPGKNETKNHTPQIRSKNRNRDNVSTPNLEDDRFYSSEYLLRKYAVKPKNHPLADMDQLNNEDESLTAATLSDPFGTHAPSTPRGIQHRRRAPFSDSKASCNIRGRGLAENRHENQKLSYLNLAECRGNSKMTPSTFRQFQVGSKLVQNGRKVESDYLRGKFVEKVAISSPTCSNHSREELLVQKGTSDTVESSTSNRFDWERLCDSREFHSQKENFSFNSTRKRFDWDRLTDDSPIKSPISPDCDTHASHKRTEWSAYRTSSEKESGMKDDTDFKIGQNEFHWEIYNNDSENDYEDEDFGFSSSKSFKSDFKAWMVWIAICVVFLGVASCISAYYFLGNESERLSVLTRDFGITDCVTNVDFQSDRLNAIQKLLSQSLGNETMIYEQYTPQRKAICWISESDDYFIEVSDLSKGQIAQRYSLAVLYFATIDREGKAKYDLGSLRHSDFLSVDHECNWDGILCNPSREVVILRLSNKHLVGNIPPEIGNLRNLTFIDFSLNGLTGTIPVSITELTSLEYLSLALNNFQTTIPTIFGQLTSLKSLNLRSSKVTQEIPTELGNLVNLETLLLDGNLLSGTIPSDLANLYNVEQMNFRENNITGEVLNEVCKLHTVGSLIELAVDVTVACECCI